MLIPGASMVPPRLPRSHKEEGEAEEAKGFTAHHTAAESKVIHRTHDHPAQCAKEAHAKQGEDHPVERQITRAKGVVQPDIGR